MLKSVWVNHIRIAQQEDGNIAITVHMTDDFLQTITVTRADFLDLKAAVEAFCEITHGQRNRN